MNIQDLSMCYAFIEKKTLEIATKVMDWVESNENFSVQATYLVQTSQRLIDNLQPRELPKDSVDLAQIHSSLRYLELIDENVINFLKGNIDGASIIKLGGKELWEEFNHNDITMRIFNKKVANTVKYYIKDKDVLELGGGVGGTTLELKDFLFQAKSFTFTDLKPYFLQTIRQKIPELPLNTQIIDLHNLPKMEDKFDVIYATNVLHVSINPINTLKWVKNHLKDEGVLIIGEGSPYSEVTPWPLELMFAFFEAWWKVPLFSYRPYQGWIIPKHWRVIFQKSGFGHVEADILMDDERIYGAVYTAQTTWVFE